MDLIVFDTETTGVKSTDDFVELAALIVLGNGEVYQFCERANPGYYIAAEASAVHGIYNEDVEGCDPPQVVADRFLADICPLVSDLSQIYWAGHNTSFDQRIMKKYYRISLFERSICTLSLSRKYYPNMPDHKLGTLAYHLGLDDGTVAHSALGDVTMTYRLLNLIMAKTGSTLAELATDKKPLTVMPFGKYKGKRFCDIPHDYMRYMTSLPDMDVDVKTAMRKELGYA